jgi:hypothetical protein
MGRPGINRRRMLRWMLKQYYGDFDWARMDQERILLNAMINLRAP